MPDDTQKRGPVATIRDHVYRDKRGYLVSCKAARCQIFVEHLGTAYILRAAMLESVRTGVPLDTLDGTRDVTGDILLCDLPIPPGGTCRKCGRTEGNEEDRPVATCHGRKTYTVSVAAYSGRWGKHPRAQYAVRDHDGESGYKGRAAGLLEALGFRWTNRESAYIGNATQLARFRRLYADGWGGNVFDGTLYPPHSPTTSRAV